MENPFLANDQQVIRKLQGIVFPAVECFNQLSADNRRRYAPYLIGGKDAVIKLQILLYKNSYTEEVIRELLRRDKSLCKVYLENSKNLLMRENANLPEFKKQVIASNNEALIRLLLNFYALTPWEEADLLKIRCLNQGQEADRLMEYYFLNNHLCSPARKLLWSPQFARYLDLYMACVPVSGWENLQRKFRISWSRFRQALG